MHNKTYKKAIVFALVLTMLMPLGSMAADDAADKTKSDSASVSTTEKTSDQKEDDEDEVQPITDEEAIALESCEEVASNDNFILYADEENDRLCLFVKSSKKYWWTSPINVQSDNTIIDVSKNSTMKPAVRKQIASSLAIRVGDLRQEKKK